MGWGKGMERKEKRSVKGGRKEKTTPSQPPDSVSGNKRSK